MSTLRRDTVPWKTGAAVGFLIGAGLGVAMGAGGGEVHLGAAIFLGLLGGLAGALAQALFS